MTSTILNKVYRWAGATMVAGATMFAIAPSDGCTGNFEVTVDPLTSLLQSVEEELGSVDEEWYCTEEESYFDEESLW